MIKIYKNCRWFTKMTRASMSSHPSHRISFRQIKYRYNLNKLYKIARALNHPAHSLPKQAHTSLSSHPSQTTISCTQVAHVNQCLVVNEALTSVNWEPFIGATLCTLFLSARKFLIKNAIGTSVVSCTFHWGTFVSE